METNVTIDDLAIMINRGFEEIDHKIDNVKNELKQDIKEIRNDLEKINVEID